MTSVRRLRGLRIVPAVLLGVLLLSAALPTTSQPRAVGAPPAVASLERDWADLYALLITLERADGIVYGALAKPAATIRESEVYEQLTRRVAAGAPVSRPDPESDAGYAVLGARGVEIIRRTNAFYREVLAIFATVEAADREAALDEAVNQYMSRPEVALPDVPKDMTILYDHPYTSFVFDPDALPRPDLVRRKAYPSLTGFLWATHWFQLAAMEPFDVSTDAVERRQGLDLVADRFQRKLSFGKPPDAFPKELPLTPTIAPGLISIHLRSAAIIDNLNLMHDVLGDVLVSPAVKDRRKTIDEVIAQFTDRRYRVVDVDESIKMALRHSIFDQGGPALGIMTKSERNSSGHLQHLAGGGGLAPGMR